MRRWYHFLAYVLWAFIIVSKMKDVLDPTRRECMLAIMSGNIQSTFNE